jgi:hypothetical protein
MFNLCSINNAFVVCPLVCHNGGTQVKANFSLTRKRVSSKAQSCVCRAKPITAGFVLTIIIIGSRVGSAPVSYSGDSLFKSRLEIGISHSFPQSLQMLV